MTIAWRIRLLLAAITFTASELLLATMPARSPFDWGVAIIGYIALAALLLDMAARLRLRDTNGILALGGIYGIINGLLLTSQATLADFPRTFFTRALGGKR